MEALASTKTLKEGGYSYVGAVHTPKPGMRERERERERAGNCEQCRFIFGLSRDKETNAVKLIPDVALVCKMLQEKLPVETNSQHSAITTISATDPSNSWSWSMILDFIATKQIYEFTMLPSSSL